MNLNPARLHYIAIAAISFSMLAMQVLLSRIFSVMFYYHFAFAGVTFAMLGLTAGALKVYSNPKRFTPATVNKECALHCMVSAVALVIATLIFVDIPGRLLSLAADADVVWIIVPLCAVAFLIGAYGFIRAFMANGVMVTMLLTYFPSHTNRLYAVDLVSASLGALLIIAGLMYLDPVSIILLLASMLGLLAWRFSDNDLSSKSRKIIRGLAVLICIMFAFQSTSYLAGKPVFKVRIGKFAVLENLLFERWNTYSHVAIYPNSHKEPAGWGFGSKLKNADYSPEQYWLRIDADAGTVLTGFNGDLAKIGYLKYDVINLGYNIRNIEKVAVIGVGGGRDILSALTFHVKDITGIEINPAIFEALNHAFVDFTGHLGSYPNIHLANAEARSFINSHDARYDMIQISLIDTWAATAAGGLSLSENKLYTREAWAEFFNHLNDNGMLTVSRWFFPNKHTGEFYRMLSLASDTIKTLNPNSDPRDHIMVANAGQIVAMVVSKSPFTKQEIENFRQSSEKYGFTPFIAPGLSFDKETDIIASGKATPAFYNSLALNVASPSDDQPFFFNMARIKNILFQPEEKTKNAGNNTAIKVLFLLAMLTIVAVGYSLIWPLIKLYRQQRAEFAGSGPYIGYFISIGLGFMFIEMALMQKLMIFLGHPVYALSVILFTMLLFSGIGSYTINSMRLKGRMYITRPLLLCLLLIITGILSNYVVSEFATYDTIHRVLISIILLIPASLAMGMMFPLGVGAAQRDKTGLLPWFWALNGVASVFASIFSMITSMSYGINLTYSIGVFCYVLCFAICLYLHNSTRKLA